MNVNPNLLQSKPKTFIIHIFVWIFYIFYESSILLYTQAFPIYWSEICLAFLLNAIVFYTSALYILPKWGNSRYLGLAILGLIILSFCYVIACYGEAKYLFPLIDKKDSIFKEPANIKIIQSYIAQHIYRVTYFLLLSFGYWFAEKSIKSERKLRIAEKKHYADLLIQQELKREIAVSKLAFYRAQLNPHFFANTLNFFYAKIYQYSKELAGSITTLADFLRYITTRSETEELVLLTEEIELIRNYIKLNQMRFEDALQIKFEVKGIPNHKKIAPFIMLNLTENAFKFGELLDPKNPVIIKIEIMANRLELNIENMIQTGEKPMGTSVGLGNLKKQLELIYGSNFSLSTTEQKNKFKCNLKINKMEI